MEDAKSGYFPQPEDIKTTRYLTTGLDHFIELAKEKKQNRESKLPIDEKTLKNEEKETLTNFINWWEPQKNLNIWIGITGSWRYINNEIIKDATEIIRYLTSQGVGIINGGALGVDFVANEILLKEGIAKNKLRIVLPIIRDVYIDHYLISARRKIINISQANKILDQFKYIDINYPEIIFDESAFSIEKFLEPKNDEYRKECYYHRNNLEAYACDGLIAFSVNESKGVKDTVNSVEKMNKPIFMTFEYQINPKTDAIISDYNELEIPNLPYHQEYNI